MKKMTGNEVVPRGCHYIDHDVSSVVWRPSVFKNVKAGEYNKWPRDNYVTQLSREQSISKLSIELCISKYNYPENIRQQSTELTVGLRN